MWERISQVSGTEYFFVGSYSRNYNQCGIIFLFLHVFLCGVFHTDSLAGVECIYTSHENVPTILKDVFIEKPLAVYLIILFENPPLFTLRHLQHVIGIFGM